MSATGAVGRHGGGWFAPAAGYLAAAWLLVAAAAKLFWPLPWDAPQGSLFYSVGARGGNPGGVLAWGVACKRSGFAPQQPGCGGVFPGAGVGGFVEDVARGKLLRLLWPLAGAPGCHAGAGLGRCRVVASCSESIS